MTDKITAPFTIAQVDELNRCQRAGLLHFTCGNDHSGDKSLVATRDGWICPNCGYRRDWAHADMAGELPPKPARDSVSRGLEAIAGQIRCWLDWHKQSRDKEHLVTDGNTSIMALPVPMWPSHAQFERWISLLNDARAAADSNAVLLASLKEFQQHIIYDEEGDLTAAEFSAMCARADDAVAKAEGQS